MNWDERYSEADYVYGTEPNAFLASVGDRIPPGEVISLGAGEGRNEVYLAQRGYKVHAVDGSHVGLAKALALAAARGVEIQATVADLADYDPGESRWSAAILIFCHLPALLRRRVHQRVLDALRPGGVVVLEAYAPAQLSYGTGGPRDLETLYDLSTLEQDFAGLEWLHARELVRPVCEGRYHTGDGAVVQLLARKPGLEIG